MKLLLASSPDLNTTQLQRLLELVGKSRASKALVITTAAVPYGLSPKPEWLERAFTPLWAICDELEETTLEDGSYLPGDLQSYDFIYVSGGNTFYLAYQLHKTGWDKKLVDYINSGGVYVGSSAGAIILMDNIEHFATADDRIKAPAICPGLGLLTQAIIPHADNAKYSQLAADIAQKYQTDGLVVTFLNDKQALLINDDGLEII
ncbi:MAG: hypothetical protein RLZZ360_411 [Candidatus Parcubacteria bacterium]|jgi:dipeptidase E